MSKDTSAEDNDRVTDTKKVIAQFAKDLAKAKSISPEEVRKVMAQIDSAMLPASNELNELKKEAEAAEAAAASAEKNKIAEAVAASLGNKGSVVDVQDKLDKQHADEVCNNFPGLNEALKEQHKRIGLVDGIIVESTSKDSISEQSIKNLHEYLLNHNVAEEIEGRKKLAEIQRAAIFKQNWHEAEKEEIATAAKNLKIELHEEKQKLPQHLVTKKVQLKREWDDHEKARGEAAKILAEANVRAKELSEWDTGVAKVKEMYKAQGIEDKYINRIQEYQDTIELASQPLGNKNVASEQIIGSRKSETQTLNLEIPTKSAPQTPQIIMRATEKKLKEVAPEQAAQNPKETDEKFLGKNGAGAFNAEDLENLKNAGAKLQKAHVPQAGTEKTVQLPTPTVTNTRVSKKGRKIY